MYKKNINGILLLDKPKGISSNNILQKIKKMFCPKKIGYIGTLDPLATGVLPICFGECTKLSDYLLDSQKLYHTILKLGQITSTYDSEGVILEERLINFSHVELYTALKKLTGALIQVVPLYSAAKYRGYPLYKYAHKNIHIPKIKKNIFIYQIHCIKYNNKYIELEILCSKGTYIRTLAYDLGRLLRCGAHVISLNRIQSYNFNIKNSITFKNLYYLYILNYRNFLQKNINIFFLPIKKFFFQLPEIIFSSYSFLKNQDHIHPIFNSTNQLVRITIKNNHNIYIIGKLNSIGQLIKYKILNIQ